VVGPGGSDDLRRDQPVPGKIDDAFERLLHHRGAHAAIAIHHEQRFQFRMDGEECRIDIRCRITAALGHDVQCRKNQPGVSLGHRVSASLAGGLPNGAKLVRPSVAR
jgi:hypothetical protein